MDFPRVPWHQGNGHKLTEGNGLSNKNNWIDAPWCWRAERSGKIALNYGGAWPIILGNMPAMPLTEAHFGGLFFACVLGRG